MLAECVSLRGCLKRTTTMPSILVTGAGGQLGQSLQRVVAARGDRDWHFLPHEALEICRPDMCLQVVRSLRPSVIINCAAYTAVDRAETEQDITFAVNAQAVENIVRAAEAVEAVLIHISTDYVFGGEGNVPHLEGEIPIPQCVYAATKREGELRALSYERTMVIRTGWLYSQFGHNFYLTVAKHCAASDAMRIVFDQVGTPTWAGNLAVALRSVALSGLYDPGVYHYTDLGVASWYDFTVAIQHLLGSHNLIVPIRSHEYPQAAQRPAYSVLDSAFTREHLGLEAVHWTEGLEQCYRMGVGAN